jgi:hypothetical protein
MWKRLRQLTGGVWLALGVVFLLNDFAELLDHGFSLNFAYYVVVWGYLILCILAGAILLNGAFVAKWLTTALAGSLALYIIIIWAKASDVPFWFQLWCGTILGFGAWSIFVVQRRNA